MADLKFFYTFVCVNYTSDKMNTNNNYCLILAGGRGLRLWPYSRMSFPKQFVDFFGVGRSQLQQTFDRFAQLIDTSHIFVSTNESYDDIVRNQLPELPSENILVEPIYRSTAPSVAWASHRILRLCADANIVVTPSDQAIQKEDAFQRDIIRGLEFVSRTDGMLTLGVKPTRPEPGYGYIQMGKEVENDVFAVQSFTEKPDREFAQMFMKSGEFYWNTGLFLLNARFAFKRFSELLPPVLRQYDAENPQFDIHKEAAFIRKNFPLYPNLSIEHGILESTNDVYVMQCHFGWADLGTWHGMYETMRKGEKDNVVIDSDVILEDSSNNIIKLAKGKLGVINGLDGFIVVEKDNVLLICKKEDSSAKVRKYVNEVRLKKGDGFV